MVTAPSDRRQVVLQGLGPFVGPALARAIHEAALVEVRHLDDDEPLGVADVDLLLVGRGIRVGHSGDGRLVVVLAGHGVDTVPTPGVSACNMELVDLATLLRAIITNDWSQIDDTSARRPAAYPALSRREREVLAELALGDDGPSVARRLGISAKTVDNHKQSIYRKLGVQSQAHAVRRAAELGMLTVRRPNV